MDNRTKILQAAITVFAENGKEGARVDKIAALSGLNKAMIYYYFTSKDLLFEEVLSRILIDVFQEIEEQTFKALSQTEDPVELLRIVVRTLFESFASREHYATLINSTLAKHSDMVRRVLVKELTSRDSKIATLMHHILNMGKPNNIFREIDIQQLEINLVGMTLIYYIAKPIAEALLLEEVDEEGFLERRIDSTIDLLLYGILRR